MSNMNSIKNIIFSTIIISLVFNDTYADISEDDLLEVQKCLKEVAAEYFLGLNSPLVYAMYVIVSTSREKTQAKNSNYALLFFDYMVSRIYPKLEMKLPKAYCREHYAGRSMNVCYDEIKSVGLTLEPESLNDAWKVFQSSDKTDADSIKVTLAEFIEKQIALKIICNDTNTELVKEKEKLKSYIQHISETFVIYPKSTQIFNMPQLLCKSNLYYNTNKLKNIATAEDFIEKPVSAVTKKEDDKREDENTKHDSNHDEDNTKQDSNHHEDNTKQDSNHDEDDTKKKDDKRENENTKQDSNHNEENTKQDSNIEEENTKQDSSRTEEDTNNGEDKKEDATAVQE